MNQIADTLHQLDWAKISSALNNNGFACVPGLIGANQCEELIRGYPAANAYRKTVVMERYRFGLGEYKYYNYPLPPMVQSLRENIYPYLVPVANQWMSLLNIETEFPSTHESLQAQCHAHEQSKLTPLILKYGIGGFNTLHQDLYGDVYFPLQAAICLNKPGADYAGGEFVMTQQIPRAQSKVSVLNPQQGDMIIFTTNFRPIKGAQGYYRANMRHGVSEVTRGTRHTLGIIFHDAVS